MELKVKIIKTTGGTPALSKGTVFTYKKQFSKYESQRGEMLPSRTMYKLIASKHAEIMYTHKEEIEYKNTLVEVVTPSGDTLRAKGNIKRVKEAKYGISKKSYRGNIRRSN